jgi:hypothetical protein
MSTFSITPSTKKNLLIAMALGVVLFVLGYLFAGDGSGGHGHGHDTHDTHVTEQVGAHGDAVDMHAADTVIVSEEEVASADVSSEGYVYEDVSAQRASALQDHIEHSKVSGAGITKGSKAIASIYSVVIFLFFIALTGMFFLSGATLAYGGWQIQIQKLPLALSATFLVSVPLMIVMWATAGHTLFHWMHTELMDPASPSFDALLASKQDYLNVTGFWVRAAILLSITALITLSWWKAQNKMDLDPSLSGFKSMRALAAVSIVLIAMVLDTFGTWDWIMSIQPHWFSTLYPWYVFASAAVSMFSIVQLLIIYLKSKDYLSGVNENHIHDIGKFMFAISVFWTYLWVSQYMLIWYGNIPEETIYFLKRLDGYPFLFWFSFILNFIVPFFVLMKREAKRNMKVVSVMAVIIIFGHALDFFLMVTPEIAPKGGFGLMFIGSLVFFSGLAAYVTLTALSRVKNLESTTHPYYKESVLHHI